MSKPFYVALRNRGLIRIEGEDRKAFLQGLVSNDVLKASDQSLVYACLLTPQGKFLHDFFVSEKDGALILDCEGLDRASDLHDRLLKFKLRSKVVLTVEENNEVYAVFNSDQGVKDPRAETMGNRSFQKPDMDEQPFEAWDKIRIDACIPDGSRDMELERSTLLECRIDKAHGIDWNKGCYMGQELTARMHYRGLAKKHLYTVDILGAAPAPFEDLANGGNMRSSCGNTGLALLRDDTIETFDYGTLKARA